MSQRTRWIEFVSPFVPYDNTNITLLLLLMALPQLYRFHRCTYLLTALDAEYKAWWVLGYRRVCKFTRSPDEPMGHQENTFNSTIGHLGRPTTHTHTDQWKNLHRKNMNMIGVTRASMTTSNIILYLNSVSCIQISALSFHQEPRLRNQSIYCQIHKKSFDVLIKWDSLIILLSVSPLKVNLRLRFFVFLSQSQMLSLISLRVFLPWRLPKLFCYKGGWLPL